jgi:hypothetical protein
VSATDGVAKRGDAEAQQAAAELIIAEHRILDQDQSASPEPASLTAWPELARFWDTKTRHRLEGRSVRGDGSWLAAAFSPDGGRAVTDTRRTARPPGNGAKTRAHFQEKARNQPFPDTTSRHQSRRNHHNFTREGRRNVWPKNLSPDF